MPFNRDVGLPTSMNPIEVATIYDPDGGGGLFFSDIDGDPDASIPSLQFTLSAAEVAGFWVGKIPPGSTVSMPRLAIGVFHTGDWHEAVDYWVEKHRERIRFSAIPEWLRNQGAIYSFAGGGAGGIYLEESAFPRKRLAECIDSFLDLPRLFGEARQFGTNVVYLWDYWEGTNEGDPAPYFNKGDYWPRDDKKFGGEKDLIEGIRLLHEAGRRSTSASSL